MHAGKSIGEIVFKTSPAGKLIGQMVFKTSPEAHEQAKFVLACQFWHILDFDTF